MFKIVFIFILVAVAYFAFCAGYTYVKDNAKQWTHRVPTWVIYIGGPALLIAVVAYLKLAIWVY